VNNKNTLPADQVSAGRPGHARLRASGHAAFGRVNVLYLLFWISLSVVAYLGMNALTAPKIVRITSGNDATSEIVIPRSGDGHYYVEGAINDHVITFMVDTGATTVAVAPSIAFVAGLPKGYPATFATAGGEAQGENVPRQSVTVAGMHFKEVTIAVIEGVGEVALLGQNILRHLSVTQSGDRMILRSRAH
jgi:aspartyl protease family protein